MRRIGTIVLVVLLALSLVGNALLGWTAWTAQKEYRALARQFVKTRQELAAATKAAPAPTAPTPMASAPAAATTAEGSKSQAPPPAPASGTTSTATVESIRAAYAPPLQAVQTQCEGQLNAMLESAKAEYQQARAAGGKVDVAALGARYLAKADGLRRQCDRQVGAITDEMAADLRAAGLPLDLVAEVRSAYEARIVERQAEIMAKAPQ